jgi:hypothetical protein
MTFAALLPQTSSFLPYWHTEGSKPIFQTLHTSIKTYTYMNRIAGMYLVVIGEHTPADWDVKSRRDKFILKGENYKWLVKL